MIFGRATYGRGIFGRDQIKSASGGGGTVSLPTTVGGMLGPIGIGSSVGMLEGSLFGPHTQQSQTLGMIGSIGGATAGALAGTFLFPGVGTLLGALLGGAAGGALGVFGPRPPNPYSSIPITVQNGRLAVGAQTSQDEDPNKLRAELADTQNQVNNLNSILDTLHLGINQQLNPVQIGDNSPKGYQDPNKYSSFNDAMPQFRFSTTQGTIDEFGSQMASAINKALDNHAFNSPEDLTQRVAATENFISNVMPAFGDLGTPLGSVSKTHTQITQQYASAVQQAAQLNQLDDGFAQSIATQYYAALNYADAQAAHQVGQILQQNQLGTETNAATLSGSPSQVQQAKLDAFDASAKEQEYQLGQQLVGIYGQTYASTQAYADQIAALDANLAQQRLILQQQYNQQTIQQQEQLQATLAQNQIGTQSAAAQLSGDPAAIQAAKLAAFDEQTSEQVFQLGQSLTSTYGLSFASTSDYANQIAALETNLAEQRLVIQQQYADQSLSIARQTAASLATNQANYASAAAQISGDPAQVLAAQLQAFDVSSTQQINQLDEQLRSTYGDSFTSSQTYADQMAALEKSLGEQRLAIQQQYNNQLLATADSTIVSLKNYAIGLQYGSSSPLTPQAQYALATSQFNAVNGAAQAGDFTSIQELQSYAQNFLSTSRAVNGSGIRYVQDYQTVLAALSTIASQPTQQLTADVYVSQTLTQTQTLVTNLQQIQQAIVNLQAALNQNVNMPSRIAA